jgi:hypothetical protein
MEPTPEETYEWFQGVAGEGSWNRFCVFSFTEPT